jgi:O-antigen ligase
VPDNKLYHQLIIFLLWLPALLAVFQTSFRQVLKQPEWLIFAAFVVWTWLVMAVEGGDDLLSKAKVTLYVTLTLLGILLASANPKWKIELLLFYASVVGGLFAAVSVVWFLGGTPESTGYRVVAIGLWDQIIMAAHAVGALAVVGIFLRVAGKFNSRSMAWVLLPLIGYVLFLGLSQTRGVWLALLACLLVMVVGRPTRMGLGLMIMTAIGLLGVVAVNPEMLLQRGMSYRGTLWSGGFELLVQNWQTGLGFRDYLIAVPETGLSFKHPHNLFLDTGVRLGVPGLLLFCALWLTVGWRGWRSRAQPLGRTLLALWVFSGVSFMTDGIGLWLKPNADWLITWLPIGLSLVLASRDQLAVPERVIRSGTPGSSVP